MIVSELPLVSVITITFNAARELPPTLRSVKEQTFRGFEHIVIDGASADDTVSVARREGVEGLRLVSEPDRGLYDAMNKGLKTARGKYVVFLNAGDSFADASVLQAYADAAMKDPDIIYADTDLVDAGRKVVGHRHLSAPDVLTFESFSHGMLVCHQAFMVRRSIAPRYDLRYRFSADYEWCIRCLQHSRHNAGLTDTVFIDYLNEGVTSSNKISSLLERFRIMAYYYGWLPTVARHIKFAGRALKRRLK